MIRPPSFVGLVGTIGVLVLDCEIIDSAVDCKGCGVVVAEEPLGDADELEAEGGVLDRFEPPPFDVEDDLDLSGAFPLAFLIPDVSSTRRLLSLSGRFLAMENKLVLIVTNKERIDRAAKISLSNTKEEMKMALKV